MWHDILDIFCNCHFYKCIWKILSIFSGIHTKKVEGPFTSTVLLESPSISHTWRFILTILTLPFSLTTSKGQNFKTFQNVVYSAFSAWWGKPHSGSVTPFEILKYFPYRNFAPGWFLEAVVEAKKTKQDVTETAGTQRSLALFMAYPTPPHQKTLHTFILMLETR